MLGSEKKSFHRFLAIYILLITLVIFSVSIIYFNANNERIKLQYKTMMQELSVLQIKRLKWLHKRFPKYKKYPRDERFNSAIYDLEYQEIFSTLKSKKINFNKSFYFTKNYAIYVALLSDYYLGAKYLFIEVPKNSELYFSVIRAIALYALIAFILLLALGFYLAKLFIRPMQNSIELLDNFIKDTTHEINTPISIINTNLELLKESSVTKSKSKIIRRVEIASKTLETIYKDLKLSVLTPKSIDRVQACNLKEVVSERIEYFRLHMEMKKITLTKELDDVTLLVDRVLIERLIDNLISNAIKYNRVGGSITITLNKSMFIVADSGVGIKRDNLERIFERYRRFSGNEGGFGIGLDIVQSIAKRYNFTIDVQSEENIGTKVVVLW